MMVDPTRFEQARRRIAADVLELRAVKLRFRSIIRSLEEGYAEMSEALGLHLPESVIGEPKPEIA